MRNVFPSFIHFHEHQIYVLYYMYNYFNLQNVTSAFIITISITHNYLCGQFGPNERSILNSVLPADKRYYSFIISTI